MSNSPKGEERLTIWANSNTGRGKFAAAAVHTALNHYGIDHGAVIVLGAKPKDIEELCDDVIHDAGRTEVEPGTVTAGVFLSEFRGRKHVVAPISKLEADLVDLKAEMKRHGHGIDIADVMAVLRKYAR